ncbi:MAG: ferrous iron transport protein B [Bacteroidota bacterium]|nr:ferrous iron transport protein B [Bacteroidota bacterium]
MITQTAHSTPLVTLVGPPNSGKTTLFNYLSGKHYKTVNYPGSTVDYSVSKMQDKFNINANLLDSPGIISLIPASPDEEVSVHSLYKHPKYGNPDLIIATADSTQLSRHLLLVRQLLESGFRVIVVLTMSDLLNKRNFDVSTKRLSELLNCDVIKLDGRNGTGLDKLLNLIEINLNNSLLSGKPDTTEYKLDNSSPLINMFRESEEIEKEVIFRVASTKNISKADKELQILSNYQIDNTTIKIDRFLLHKYWGIFGFFAIMSITFTSVFWLAQPLMNLVDKTFGFLANFAQASLGDTWYSDLISNGLISGIGSVLVFVPQIIILFLILGLLEDSGYLARGAMLIDKPLSKIGLNGKSFVPMLSGFACAIPAIMAARTISNKRERLLTIFIIPLISCSARLPVYALLIGFLVPNHNQWLGGVILASIYIFGIISSVVISAIINKFSKFILRNNDNSSFILELPSYRMPKLSVVINNTVTNAEQYIKRAGPTILALSIAIWMLSYFPNNNPKIEAKGLSSEQVISLKSSERLAGSYSAQLGKFIQPVMTPLGMDWRVGVSLVSAFAAREVFVSSLAMIFRVTDSSDNLQSSILHSMRNAEIEGTNQKLFTPATILGLIVFFIFALQCISTISISYKESGTWRIPLFQVLIFTGLAYIFTFITVNGLRAIGIN